MPPPENLSLPNVNADLQKSSLNHVFFVEHHVNVIYLFEKEPDHPTCIFYFLPVCHIQIRQTPVLLASVFDMFERSASTSTTSKHEASLATQQHQQYQQKQEHHQHQQNEQHMRK